MSAIKNTWLAIRERDNLISLYLDTPIPHLVEQFIIEYRRNILSLHVQYPAETSDEAVLAEDQ